MYSIHQQLASGWLYSPAFFGIEYLKCMRWIEKLIDMKVVSMYPPLQFSVRGMVHEDMAPHDAYIGSAYPRRPLRTKSPEFHKKGERGGQAHTQTYTHTHIEREREREK